MFSRYGLPTGVGWSGPEGVAYFCLDGETQCMWAPGRGPIYMTLGVPKICQSQAEEAFILIIGRLDFPDEATGG